MATLGSQDISTLTKEQIIDAFAKAGNKKALAASQTNIPVGAIENNAPPALNIPQPSLPNVNAGAAIASSEQLTGSLQEQYAQEKANEVKEAREAYTTTDKLIREKVGIIGTESKKRAELEESIGLNQAKEKLNQISNRLFQQTAELREFNVQSLERMNMLEVEASKRGITKRTFASMSREEMVKQGLQRARMVADIHTTQAEMHLLQGNIQLAAESIDKALSAAYDPIRMELQMEMMFFQRNAQVLDAAQNREANARMAAIAQKQHEIDRAEDMVYNAVSNGYATPDEIQEMMALSGDPKQQRGLAQMITNRGAAQMRALQIQQMQMSIAASQAALNAKNKPDPMQGLLMSLFMDDEGPASFEDYVLERTGMPSTGSLSPDMLARLQEEYNQIVGSRTTADDKNKTLTFLVASGAVTPQVADYIRANLEFTSPQDQKKQADAIAVAQTVWRDLNSVLGLAEHSGAQNAKLLDQIEGRAGNESQLPLIGAIQRAKTRKMAGKAQLVYDLKGALDSVKGNISVESLQRMRENSPTGGALGNVSDKQSAMLEGLYGNLSLEQSPSALRKTVQDISNIYLNVIYGSPDEISSAYKAGRMSYEQAQEALMLRQSQSPETLGLDPSLFGGERVRRLLLNRDGSMTPILDKKPTPK